MDPQSNDSPGLRLPQPSMHQGNVQHAPASQSPMIATTPSAHHPVAPIVSEPQPTHGLHIQHYQPQATSPHPSTGATLPDQAVKPAAPEVVTVEEGGEAAADEEWIARAKAATEQYRSDPYMLSNALSKIKADYLMARHGKMVKTNNPTT